MASESQNLSAEVVLRSASGKEFGGDTAITAETIADFVPSPANVERATMAFLAAGFATSPAHGLGFSIDGPQTLFERFFGTRIESDERGAMRALHRDKRQHLELPLDAIDPALRDLLVAVTFSEPPDFGPGGFGSDY